MMNLSFVAASLLTAVVSLAFSVFVYAKRHSLKANRVWGLFGISCALWSLGLGMMSFAPNEQIALFWLKYVHYVGAIFIPPIFFHFVTVLIENDYTKQGRRMLAIAYTLAGLLLIANFTGVLATVKPVSYFHYYTAPKALYNVFGLYFLFYVVYSLYLLLKAYLNATDIIRRNQLKYLLLGMTVGFIGGSTAFFPVYDIEIFPFGMYFASSHVAIVSYAMIKFRLMDIRIAVTRAGIFLTVYMLVLGLPFWYLFAYGLSIQLYIATIVLATLGPIIYRYLDEKAEELLLAAQRHYQKLLVDAASGMTEQHSLSKLLKLVVYLVKRIVKVSYAAILLYDKETNSFILKEIRASEKMASLSAPFIIDSTHYLFHRINESDEPFLFNELPKYVQDAFNFPIKPGLIVPSYYQKKPIGVLFLGNKMNNEIFTQDDIRVFKILASQSALAVENCIFITESKNSQEKIFHAEKLASVGGMAEGIAHQIGNRLNQFSVAAGELELELGSIKMNHSEYLKTESFRTSVDYISKLVTSILSNVKKTDAVIRSILNFAKPGSENKVEFSLIEMTNSVTELICIKHRLREFPYLKFDIKCSDVLFAIKEQMSESIFNLLDNSFESIQDKILRSAEAGQPYPDPNITVSLKEKDGLWQLAVSDNGMGISDSVKRKIFAPFFTTKSSTKSGSGIGMYVVKRIIEERHNGKIWFESQEGQGTTFFIEIPRGDN